LFTIHYGVNFASFISLKTSCMKHCYFIFCAGIATSVLHPAQAQPVGPTLEWSQSYPVPEDAINFCDDLGPILDFTSYYASPVENGLVSIDAEGSINYLITETGIPALKSGPMINIGASTYVFGINNSTQTLLLSLYDNIDGSVISDHMIDMPENFNQCETLGSTFRSDAGHHYIRLLIKVFDTTDNKWKALFAKITIDLLGDTATHEFTTVFVGAYATMPVNIIGDAAGNAYIWGYFNKNAGGTNHDNFVVKFNAAGILQYTKTFASYAGRDDIAVELAVDQAGNLYGVSASEDNVSPYYDHIAVFKIKALNGKLLWTKRFGEAAAGNEQVWDVAGNTAGEGLAFTGSIPTVSGGRDSRTWRLNGAGNTLWAKTINLDLVSGSTEEGKAICFNRATGDVMVAGFVFHTVFMERYNTSTGVAAWPVELYEGIESGLVLNNKMIITSSLTGDDLLLFPSENTGGSCCRTSVARYTDMVMRSDSEIEDMGVTLYPNPAGDIIQVEGAIENSFVEIYNMSGQMIFSEQMISGSDRINVQHFNPGYYTVRIVSGDRAQTLSFIKTN